MLNNTTYFQIEKLFSELQNNKKIFDIEINGWPIWSIIKTQLYSRCGSSLVSNRKEGFFAKILRMRKQILNQLGNYLIARIEWHFIKNKLYKKRNNPLVFFIFLSHHRFKNKSGKMEYPFGESLIMQNNRRFDVFVMERTTGYSSYNNLAVKRDLRQDIIVFPGYLGFSFNRKKTKEIHAKLIELYNIIKELLPPEENNMLDIIKEELFSKLVFRTLYNFFSDKNKAHSLFKRINPNMIVLTASSGNLGTIGAAKELNIPVIEIQHGVFNEYYSVYRWPSFYKSKKNELPIPDKIFVWGQYWIDVQKRFDFWDNSELFIYGNSKMDDLKINILNQREKRKEKTIDRKVINILYTSAIIYRDLSISYFDKLLSLSTVENTPFFLNIKLHPLEDTEYNYYYTKLEKKFPRKCKVYYHKDKPLYDHFIESDLHISVISAAIFESVEIGLPTVLILHDGLEYYSDIINKGIVKHAKTPAQLFELLHLMLSKNEVYEKWLGIISDSKNYFFEKSNPRKVVEYINNLLN